MPTSEERLAGTEATREHMASRVDVQALRAGSIGWVVGTGTGAAGGAAPAVVMRFLAE